MVRISRFTGNRCRWPTISANGHKAQLSGGVEVLPGAGGDVVNVYQIKQDLCVGCNMCSLVCPVESCITMKEVDTGRPSMTWNEYQAMLGQGKIDKIQPPEHV